MKLYEALNLYSLHKNPEQLAGHDKVKQAMETSGEWVLYMSIHHTWNTWSGKCKTSELNIPNGMQYVIDPFAREKLDKFLKQEDVWNKEHLHEMEYIQALKTFVEVVAEMKNPATLLEFFNEEGGGGFAVFEHSPGLVNLALPQSYDNE